MRAELTESFAEFAATQLPGLRRFAYALCADWHRADDLVQGALERMYLAWPRVRSLRDPGAYARTVLTRLAATESRRSWWRRERTAAVLPDQPFGDHSDAAADRHDLAAALAGLTVKQRAVVLLRFIEDRPVAEVAEMLGVAPGTVKRQSHDALALLRRRLDPSRSSPHERLPTKEWGEA